MFHVIWSTNIQIPCSFFAFHQQILYSIYLNRKVTRNRVWYNSICTLHSLLNWTHQLCGSVSHLFQCMVWWIHMNCDMFNSCCDVNTTFYKYLPFSSSIVHQPTNNRKSTRLNLQFFFCTYNHGVRPLPRCKYALAANRNMTRKILDTKSVTCVSSHYFVVTREKKKSVLFGQ